MTRLANRRLDPSRVDAPGLEPPLDDPIVCECGCAPCLAITTDEAPPEAEHCHGVDCYAGLFDLDDFE